MYHPNGLLRKLQSSQSRGDAAFFFFSSLIVCSRAGPIFSDKPSSSTGREGLTSCSLVTLEWNFSIWLWVKTLASLSLGFSLTQWHFYPTFIILQSNVTIFIWGQLTQQWTGNSNCLGSLQGLQWCLIPLWLYFKQTWTFSEKNDWNVLLNFVCDTQCIG